jgi:hypothetical protein
MGAESLLPGPFSLPAGSWFVGDIGAGIIGAELPLDCFNCNLPCWALASIRFANPVPDGRAKAVEAHHKASKVEENFMLENWKVKDIYGSKIKVSVDDAFSYTE